MFDAKMIGIAGLMGLLLAGCATAKIRDSRVVTGRVTDESGQAVPGTPDTGNDPPRTCKGTCKA